MKFLAWFFAVIVLISSFFVAFSYNLHQTFLTPDKTKQVLVKVDFYNQMKSVIKKDLFGSDGNAAEISSSSKAITTSFDQYNFQPKIEQLVSDFYDGLNHPNNFILSVDLVDFKNIFISNLASDKQSAKEISNSIPNNWQVDMSQYSGSLTVVAFMYHNYNLILIIYGVLVLLFLVFCLLVSAKYLKLFFWIFLIVGIFMLIQFVFWKFINLGPFLANIESQGRSGIGTLVENLVDYFKRQNSDILLWESIYLTGPAILGLIIVALIPSKVANVPLHDVTNKK